MKAQREDVRVFGISIKVRYEQCSSDRLVSIG